MIFFLVVIRRRSNCASFFCLFSKIPYLGYRKFKNLAYLCIVKTGKHPETLTTKKNINHANSN